MFYSYKPYLQIALTRECIVTFNENGVYIAKTPEEEKLLREYAKNTRNSYNIIEAEDNVEEGTDAIDRCINTFFQQLKELVNEEM